MRGVRWGVHGDRAVNVVLAILWFLCAMLAAADIGYSHGMRRRVEWWRYTVLIGAVAAYAGKVIQ